MISHATERFWKCFEKLPKPIQAKARLAFSLWKKDSSHPSLYFKKIHNEKPIYPVRVGISHRAIGVREGNTMIWFWIGSHETYNNLVDQL
jgi:hypothetical protein